MWLEKINPNAEFCIETYLCYFRKQLISYDYYHVFPLNMNKIVNLDRLAFHISLN